MRARWPIPVVCYLLLLAVEFFAIDSALRPATSIFAFSALYLFLPLLSFALALILCASSANLFLKLLFPVVSLVIIPLGYPLIEANGYLSDNLSLEHLSADLGLALLVAFSPAVLGTVVGFIIRTVGKHMKAPSKTTGTAQKSVSARTGGGSRTRPGSGTRTKTRSNTGMPPLTVKLNTATRARSNARSNVGLNRGVRTQVGAGMRPSASAGTNGAQSSAKARPGTDTVKSSGSRSKKRR